MSSPPNKQNAILSAAAQSELTKFSLEELRVLALELVSQSLRQDEQLAELQEQFARQQERLSLVEDALRSFSGFVRSKVPARSKTS